MDVMNLKNYQKTLLLICILLYPLIHVQADADSLHRKVEGFGIVLPQEKVYLHLDNTCYFLGDTIWYKGYVTQSNTGTLTTMSRILYVDLLTPDGYLVERQQLEMPGGMAHGMFVLTDSLYAGYYELRAYTRWMLNFGKCEYPHIKDTEHRFYSKKMAKEFFRDYEKLYSRVFPVFDKPQQPGHYPKDMTLRPMRRYYKRPRERKPELDLCFYPEGGNLVEGTTARVALELNDEDALVVLEHGKEILREARTDLTRAWCEVSNAIARNRDNPACADSETDWMCDKDVKGLFVKTTFDNEERIAAPYIATGVRPKLAVLREQGVNSQTEMAAAFSL